MTDNEIIKALDVLDKFDFFQGQRAGRELWSEKPYDVQEEDVKSFSADVKFLKDFINRKKAEVERLEGKVDMYEEERKYHFEMSRQRIAEAIKEFAERMKKGLYIGCYESEYIHAYVDIIAEEMIGDQNDG